MSIAYVKMKHISDHFQYVVGNSIQLRDQVVVKTSHGIEVGKVIKITEQSNDSNHSLKIERIMNESDVPQFNLQQVLEKEIMDYAKKQMPSLGSGLESEYGLGKVIDINYISKKAKLKHRDGYVQWIDIQAQE